MAKEIKFFTILAKDLSEHCLRFAGFSKFEKSIRCYLVSLSFNYTATYILSHLTETPLYILYSTSIRSYFLGTHSCWLCLIAEVVRQVYAPLLVCVVLPKLHKGRDVNKILYMWIQ